MTWSYDATNLPRAGVTPTAGQLLNAVRRLLGDVIASDQQVADEEIAFSLTQRSNIYGAAADCCRYIAAQYSRKVDSVQAALGGQLKINNSEQAKAYTAMAAAMEALSISRGGVMPYAGGISVSDKRQVEQDTDRVSPQFNIGMDDNLLPVGPVGNETGTTSEDLEGQE